MEWGYKQKVLSKPLPSQKKTLTLYGEGGNAIAPSQTLLLDATVSEKVLVKNLTTEYVQTGFTNGNTVDQQIERERNVTNK